MALRFHLDEHVDPAIASGLRRRGIDVSTTIDAGLRGATDETHVEFARAERRVIFINDSDFLRIAQSGLSHAGMVYCAPGTRTLRQIIERLVLIAECLDEADMVGHVEFC